jgi:uncharacterized membrane protein
MTLAQVATVGVFLESVLAIHKTHDWWARFTFACIATVGILLESVFTGHSAHAFWAYFTLACVTTLSIFLESILTGHLALCKRRTSYAFASLTSVFFFLVPVFASIWTLNFRANNWFIARAQLTSGGIFFVTGLAMHCAHDG